MLLHLVSNHTNLSISINSLYFTDLSAENVATYKKRKI